MRGAAYALPPLMVAFNSTMRLTCRVDTVARFFEHGTHMRSWPAEVGFHTNSGRQKTRSCLKRKSHPVQFQDTCPHCAKTTNGGGESRTKFCLDARLSSSRRDEIEQMHFGMTGGVSVVSASRLLLSGRASGRHFVLALVLTVSVET